MQRISHPCALYLLVFLTLLYTAIDARLQVTIYISKRRAIITLSWKMFFDFFFYPEKIDRNEHTVVLKDWPLNPFLNHPFEGGQMSHKYTNTLCFI